MNNKEEIFKKEFPDIIENEPLSKHSTMKVGGPAKLFYVVKELENLIKIVRKAQELDYPYVVIGLGSNIIVSDEGFLGLVIQNKTADLLCEKEKAIAESGITLNYLIKKLAENNLGGLEFLSGIPGSLGGAVYGNSGAFGKAIGDVVNSVSILDIDGNIRQISKAEMGFGYRTSYLKERNLRAISFKQPVILSVNLQVHYNDKEAILRIAENFQKIRKSKQPTEPSAGSFFRNLVVGQDFIPSKAQLLEIKGKIPAGYLLEKSGVKGMKVGQAKISEKHANFIVNTGRARAREIKILAERAKAKVKENFGLELKEEIEYLGNIDTKKLTLWDRFFKKRTVKKRGNE